jgi:translation initiation factor 6
LEIARISILGSVNIGLYIKATNKYFLYHSEILERKIKTLNKFLRTDGIPIKPLNTRVISPFIAGNKDGVIISKYADGDLLTNIKNSMKDHGLKTVVLDTKYTALGNLTVFNDRYALVSPLIPINARRLIADELGVEVAACTIGRASYIGSLLVINNKGGLVSPVIRDDELEFIESFLKINVFSGTINSGVPFISSGLVVNDKGIIVGEDTVGRELFVLTQAFGGE